MEFMNSEKLANELENNTIKAQKPLLIRTDSKYNNNSGILLTNARLPRLV
jgi:LysM repeat protein